MSLHILNIKKECFVLIPEWRTEAKAFAKNVFSDQERKLEVRRRSDTALVLTTNKGDCPFSPHTMCESPSKNAVGLLCTPLVYYPLFWVATIQCALSASYFCFLTLLSTCPPTFFFQEFWKQLCDRFKFHKEFTLVNLGGPVVTILATGSEVCGFKSSRGQWIFFSECKKSWVWLILEGKYSRGSRVVDLRHVKEPQAEIRASEQNLFDFSRSM